ncbi:MAG: hypothetical protein CSA38_00615 [Flavobacteriales bacterium]|nr:MAG: hypothetical protein CSA38_00615 [Flavobacteriales bacterium]
MNKLFILFLLMTFGYFSAQEKSDSLIIENKTEKIDDFKNLDSEENEVVSTIQKANQLKIKKLNPTKAGLYSAVLPGLGQYYNKKYWKIPIVWGAIGTGVGISLWNQKKYKRYRNAYIAELNGLPHEFSDRPQVTKEVLGRTQDQVKRQRDYAIAITGLIYVLNIVDAVVDAHLYEGRNDPDLALKPTIIYNEFQPQTAMAGLNLRWRF